MSNTAPLPTVSEVLNQAADLIEKGWVQNIYRLNRGTPEEPNQAYCAVGALRAIVGLSVGDDTYLEHATLRRQAVITLAREVVGFKTQSPGDAEGQIFNWNDAEWRTQEEVVAGFRKAAEAAK